MTYGGQSGSATVYPLKRAPMAKRRPAAKRPCAYGDRLETGRCPPKPRARTARSGRPPCKYGPRVNGRCPKRPRDVIQAVQRDIKAGRSPIAGGSATRVVVEKAAEQTAVRTARALTKNLKKIAAENKGAGAAVLTVLRAAAVPVGLIAAGHFANAKMASARVTAVAKAAADYRTARSAIEKYRALKPAEMRALADTLRRQLERINRLYDQRGLEERE